MARLPVEVGAPQLFSLSRDKLLEVLNIWKVCQHISHREAELVLFFLNPVTPSLVCVC